MPGAVTPGTVAAGAVMPGAFTAGTVTPGAVTPGAGSGQHCTRPFQANIVQGQFMLKLYKVSGTEAYMSHLVRDMPAYRSRAWPPIEY